MPHQIPKDPGSLEAGDVFMSLNVGNGKAKCLVIEAGYAGGCDGHDPWPDAWLIRYVCLPPRIFKNSRQNVCIEKLKVQKFFQNGPFSPTIPASAVTKLGMMNLSVVTTARWIKFPKKGK